jgi:hypothetical protein
MSAKQDGGGGRLGNISWALYRLAGCGEQIHPNPSEGNYYRSLQVRFGDGGGWGHGDGFDFPAASVCTSGLCSLIPSP